MQKTLSEREKRCKERLDAFFKKARAENRMPPSYQYRLNYARFTEFWGAFAKVHLSFVDAVWPWASYNRPTKSMKECASRMLLSASCLGWVNRGQNIIQELKADVNYQDANGETPLYHAIRRKRLGMVEMLLQNGADAQKANREYLSPVLKACADDFIKAIPVFAKYGVDFNKGIRGRLWNRFYLGWKNYTIYPLIYAAVRNKVALCAELLKYGAHLDVDFKGITLRSALLRDKAEKHDSFSQEIHAVFQPYLVASKNKIPERTEKQKTRV